MRNIWISIVLVVAISGCGTVYTVEPADGSETDGVHYYLPKNIVKLTIPVTKSTTRQGRHFSDYKNCVPDHLVPKDENQNDNVYSSPTAQTKIKVSSPSFELAAVRDPEHYYFVDLSTPGNPFASKGGGITLGPDQVLNAASASATDHSVDYALGLSSALVGISGVGLPAGGSGINPPRGKKCPPQPTETLNKIVGIQEALVELAYAGRAGDKETYEQMKTDLKAAEKTLWGYFFGETSKSSYDVVVLLEPDDNLECTPGAASISDRCPATIDLFDNKGSADGSLEQIGNHLYRVNTGSVQHTKSFVHLNVTPTVVEGTDKAGGSGFVYRVPGSAVFSLVQNGKAVGQSELAIAQYGITRALPKRYGLFKSSVDELTLDPITGGIKTLKVNGAGLSKEQSDSINATLIAAERDKRVDKLTRERDILKLKKEIEDLQNPPADGS